MDPQPLSGGLQTLYVFRPQKRITRPTAKLRLSVSVAGKATLLYSALSSLEEKWGINK